MYLENLDGRNRSVNLGLHGKIILKWILKKFTERIKTVKWLRKVSGEAF
jgi:hypothetical protein